MSIYVSFLLALLLSLIHIFAHHWSFFSTIPRSQWLSFSGGISVSYVFLQILPELHEGQKVFNQKGWNLFGEHQVFLLALFGLVTFYGLERLAKGRKSAQDHRRIFWVHLASFSVYNILIGYILQNREQHSLKGVAFYFLAMGAHFFVNDFGLQATFKSIYVSKGRWILAGCIILGWLLGYFYELPESSYVILLALIAGGIILNVLKEELPEERESRFWAFLLGTFVYSLALLII